MTHTILGTYVSRTDSTEENLKPRIASLSADTCQRNPPSSAAMPQDEGGNDDILLLPPCSPCEDFP